MNGVILIDKEKDFTSFDVIAVLRKFLKTKKLGHTGTLDPNAEGLLVVLIGNATKAQDILPVHDKEYIADFRFGIQTDTLDIWGKVLKEKQSSVKKEEIENILSRFTGEIEQIPPMYSAVSVNGKRLYQLAREGKEIEREKRKVNVYSLSLLSFDEETQSGKLKIFCSKGTYIRTLIDDISKALDTIGVMTNLKRTKACGYIVEDSLKLNEVKLLCEEGKINDYIFSTESLFSLYDEVVVSDKQSVRFKNGNYLDISKTSLKQDVQDKKIYRVKDKENNFISLGIVDKKNMMLKMYKHF